MTEIPEFETEPEIGKARTALLRRLIDVVAMPATSLSPTERAITGDVLLDMLFHATEKERVLCAERLKTAREAPRRLLRYLGQCAIEVARLVLEENEAFDDSDLNQLIRKTGTEHHLIIAGRKRIGASAAENLAKRGDPQVLRKLLNNPGAVLSEETIDKIVIQSRNHEGLCGLLIKRPEFKPSQAMAMFWWASGDERRIILQKHTTDRASLINICSDVFALAAKEGWRDPVARKTLQLIERRQRNRAALDNSEFESLEDAIKAGATEGISSHIAQEIGYLSGVKPVTITKIMSDQGGEGLAVLCKATGLKRPYLRELWLGLKRPLEIDEGVPHPQFAYISETFELLSVGKAQTTLRYWNWSLSSSYSPAAAKDDVLSDQPGDDEEEFSASRRAARLVFGR